MRRASLWLVGAMLEFASPCACAAERVPTAIVFAVDVSGSVDGERYKLQGAGIAGIFADERMEPFLAHGLAAAIMEWSDGHAVAAPWTLLRMTEGARRVAGRIIETTSSPGFSTELSLALLAAADLLDACPCQPAGRVGQSTS